MRNAEAILDPGGNIEKRGIEVDTKEMLAFVSNRKQSIVDERTYRDSRT